MGKFQSKHGEQRAGGGMRGGAGGRRHSLSLLSLPCPPAAPQPQPPARGERAPKVSPGAVRARGGPGAGCAELRARGAPCLVPSGGTCLGSPGARGPEALGTGWAPGLGRSASREAHDLRLSPWVPCFPPRVRAGLRGQLRGVCICERPQRNGRDRTALRRRRGTPRTGQAGRRRGGGRGRAATVPAVSEDPPELCLFTTGTCRRRCSAGWPG